MTKAKTEKLILTDLTQAKFDFERKKKEKFNTNFSNSSIWYKKKVQC